MVSGRGQKKFDKIFITEPKQDERSLLVRLIYMDWSSLVSFYWEDITENKILCKEAWDGSQLAECLISISKALLFIPSTTYNQVCWYASVMQEGTIRSSRSSSPKWHFQGQPGLCKTLKIKKFQISILHICVCREIQNLLTATFFASMMSCLHK